MSALEAELTALVRAGATLFPDLAFLGPGGILELDVAQDEVDRIRFELPEQQYLGLQSVQLETDVDDLADLISVELSSWWRWRRDHFSLARLLDFDHPTGLVVQTDADDEPWIELQFARPVAVSALRLRNAGDATATRAAGLSIRARSHGRWQELYDRRTRSTLLADVVAGWAAQPGRSPEAAALAPVVELTVDGQYRPARRLFEGMQASAELHTVFRRVITEELLAGRGLEWTGHGPRRCFRFWTEPEKRDYVGFAAEVATALRGLTPDVCFGFGAVLSLLRDGALIPHDDDVDLLVAFEHTDVPMLPDGLRLVEEHLRPLGYTVAGNFSAHRHVSRDGRLLDVFVGLHEGDTISWYPSRRGLLSREVMFPPSTGTLAGVEVPLPRSPLVYLERVYGPGWRRPDPDFRHSWDFAPYADLLPPGWGTKR